MIEKISNTEVSPYLVGTPTALENIVTKINEIIDYINDKEKENE